MEKSRGTGDHGLSIRWNESEEDADTHRKAAITEYYNLTPDMHDAVLNALSSVGWMTVYDICSETGLSKDAVARIVRISDNVEMETSGRMCLYRRSLDTAINNTVRDE